MVILILTPSVESRLRVSRPAPALPVRDGLRPPLGAGERR